METTLEILLLAAVAGPLVPPFADARYRRAFPRQALLAAALLVGYAALVIALFVGLPPTRPWLAGGAALAVVVHLWRTRSSAGRSRRLPPGRLTILPTGPWTDHRWYLRMTRRHGPVFKTRQFLRPMICVVGLERARELLRDHDARLGSPENVFSRFIPGGFLRHMAPEDHVRYRGLLRAAFGHGIVGRAEPLLAAMIHAELDHVSRAPPGGVDLDDHLPRLVFTAFARLFFGLREGEDLERMRELYEEIDPVRMTRWSGPRVRRAVDAVLTIVLHTHAVLPEDEARSTFFGQLVRTRPREAFHPTVLGNLVFLLHTTSTDVTGLARWIVKMLVDHPRWLREVRSLARRDRAAADDLAAACVRETLRLEQSEHLYREALEDVAFAGFVIPRGWLVRVCTRESHRDPTVFEDPERFDPLRFAGRSRGREVFMPFGARKFACLGEELTVTFGRLLVRELAIGFDAECTADGPRELGPWRHWRPSPALRVALTARRRSSPVGPRPDPELLPAGPSASPS